MRTNKPIAQLAIYALALTRLVAGLKLFDIKCAWFSEEEYLEFFPRTPALAAIAREVPVSSVRFESNCELSTFAGGKDASGKPRYATQ